MFQTTDLKIHPDWEESFRAAGLLDLKSVSKRKFDWFEAPNKRRGGWSGVTRIVLNPEEPQEKQKAVFLKIQQNHFYIAPNTFFTKRLTFERENAAMMELQPHCPAVPEVLHFANWIEGGNRFAILITEALDDWLQLHDWQMNRTTLPKPDKATLHKALEAIAATSRQINEAGWVHMCFSAKHLFIKPNADGTMRVKTIDLEKTRKRIGPWRRTIKDCSHLLRYTPNLDDEDKLHYLRCYFQTTEFSSLQLKLIRRMRGAPKI
ncbi:MAG: lipopolysaccharide kinase InaA family protein [Opitutales bacterium]